MNLGLTLFNEREFFSQQHQKAFFFCCCYNIGGEVEEIHQTAACGKPIDIFGQNLKFLDFVVQASCAYSIDFMVLISFV